MKKLPDNINNDKYQVFVYSSHAHIPFSLAMHSWLVVNNKGTISRWEVLFETKNNDTSFGHLRKDALPPFQGIGIFPFTEKYSWKGKLVGYIEGDENSTVPAIIDFIERSKDTYPYRYSYMITGPNSNTYVQWVLDAFPEFKIKLPIHFVGKSYNKGISSI